MRASTAVLPLLLLCAPGSAQDFEIGPFASVGYSTSAGLDSVAPELDGAAIRGGFTWGGQVGWRFRPHWVAELSFAQQRTAFELDVAGRQVDLFEMQIGQLQGSIAFLLRDGEARVVPYLLGGLGVAFLGARDLDGEAKLSWAAGGGVKAFLTRQVGLRLQARYLQTRLGGEEGDPGCLPFGFCQDRLDQAEVLGGVVLRF